MCQTPRASMHINGNTERHLVQFEHAEGRRGQDVPRQFALHIICRAAFHP